jgi:hypothetical protein
MRRTTFLALLFAGTLVRVAALPLPGTHDVPVWKIWSYAASTAPLAVYGIGGTPPTRGVLTFRHLTTTVDYPPLAVYEMAAVGLAYRAVFPDYPDDWRLTAAVKIPGLLAGLALTGALTVGVRRLGGNPAAARWTALAYWLNPATVLNGEVLGYLDPLVMLPAVGAFLLAGAGRTSLGSAALALAVATKPQALLAGPAFALLVWRAAGWRSLLAGGTVGLTTIWGVALPHLIAGAGPNMWLAFGSWSARRDILSGYAANLWWIVTWAVRAQYSVTEFGVPGAFLVPVRRILQISRFREVGYPDPRPIGRGLLALTLAWTFWRARRARSVAVLAALGAFTVQAFFCLSVSVHEHHMLLAIPLLALAGGLHRPFRPVFYAVSATCALNMNLFYGIGMGWGWAVPRTLTPIDLSVLLAAANLGVLGWSARVVAREAAATSPGAPLTAA